MRLFSLLIIITLLLTACGKATTDDTAYYRFTDSTGYEVTLTDKPERVAVLFSSYAEIWNISGGKVTISVAESVERGFCDENTVLVDDRSGHTAINTELLLAQKPDLVIGTLDHEVQCETVKLCRSVGIAAALFRVEELSHYLEVLKICCDINSGDEVYKEYGSDIEKDIKALLDSVPDKDTDILFVRAGSAARSTKAKTAENNFVCAMLEELGTNNIAESAPILLDGLSIEEIIRRDPEHIFVTPMGDEDAAREYFESLTASEGFKELSAVKNQNIHFLPKDSFHYKPNHRWYTAYEYLYEIIYG